MTAVGRHLLHLALLAAALMLAACDRPAETAPSETPRRASTTGTAPAAAPQHYVPVAPLPAPPPVLPAVAPAPRPAGPLPPDAGCVTAECHATFASAAYIHGPVAEKSCQACHAADIGGHRYPLKADATELCTSCHPVSSASHGQFEHEAMRNGCLTCHEPHAAPSKFLLKADNVEQLCQSCHAIPLKRFAHEPFADGQCTLCHQPHRADNAKLLRGGEGATHCLTCHKAFGESFKTAAVVHEPARAECTTCHSPHATEQPHVLRAPVQELCTSCHAEVQQAVSAATVDHGAMDSRRSCAECHSGHASSQPKLILARMDELCLTCHAQPVAGDDGRTVQGMKQALKESKFLHGPIRNGDCAACHQAHGGANASLLTAAFPDTFYTSFELDKYALCFTCHERELVLTEKTATLTNFRDGERNLHYLHVNRQDKGRTCKSCHAMHGSDLPNHVAGEVSFEGSRWAMPVGFNKTADGGTCTPGCHQTASYSRQVGASPPTTQPPAPAEALPTPSASDRQSAPTTRGVP